MAEGMKYTGVATDQPTITGGTITGATINNAVIGGTTAAAGTFTNLTATGNCIIGNGSADSIGFYTSAVVTQRQSSAMPAVVTTAAINSSISSSCFGFTSAQATSIVVLVNELRAALVALGLIAT